ncbi:MAG: leucine-rich repeat domain-containing protein, partial [Enterococcus sp.]|nr:leucine-rich repeat domain-containing protein [Enterococcus sp.]
MSEYVAVKTTDVQAIAEAIGKKKGEGIYQDDAVPFDHFAQEIDNLCLTDSIKNHCEQDTEYDYPPCNADGEPLTTENEIIDHIKNRPFFMDAKLKSITLKNCKSVSGGAFYGCEALESVDMPECTSVENAWNHQPPGTSNTYNYGIFQNCTKLKTVNMPKLANTGTYMFDGCTSLESINMPDIPYVNTYTFRNCKKLASISFQSLNIVYSYAFEGCTSLATVELPSATSIGSSAFYGCT